MGKTASKYLLRTYLDPVGEDSGGPSGRIATNFKQAATTRDHSMLVRPARVDHTSACLPQWTCKRKDPTNAPRTPYWALCDTQVIPCNYHKKGAIFRTVLLLLVWHFPMYSCFLFGGRFFVRNLLRLLGNMGIGMEAG